MTTNNREEQSMSTTSFGSGRRGRAVPGAEPLYVIHLYTAIREVGAAFDLAARLAEDLAGTPEIYHYSTTVGLEDDPGSHQQIYVDRVTQRGRA
jgi:hypothetical protein